MKLAFVFLICSFFSLVTPSWAYTPQQVSEWTEETLWTTLNAGYHETVSEAANVHRHYKYKAWNAMNTFITLHFDREHNKLFKIQPKPVIPSIILRPEDCDGASCWRVHQGFLIKELRILVDISALVSTADPSHSSPLIIEDMDILVHRL